MYRRGAAHGMPEVDIAPFAVWSAVTGALLCASAAAHRAYARRRGRSRPAR